MASDLAERSKNGQDSRRAETLRKRRSLLASVTNWYHQSATMESLDRNNEVLIEVSKVECAPSRLRDPRLRLDMEVRVLQSTREVPHRSSWTAPQD